tara:strand:- start:11620 stop:15264 length:3645 start_codon:yes stop_codon:yes gene_type:complete
MNNILFTFLFLVSLVYSQNNDLIQNAISITCNSSFQSSTLGYSSDQEQLIQYGLDECGTSVDVSPGVWYYLDGNDSYVALNTCSSLFDTKIHVFSDDGFGLTCVTGNDDAYFCESSNLHSQVAFFAEQNLIYYIYISGFSSSEGDFQLNLLCDVGGCIDENAENYCQECLIDDNSCVYTTGCMDVAASNFSVDNDISDPSMCEYFLNCNSDQQLVMINLNLGSWSNEITWDIQNEENLIVANSPILNSFYEDYQNYTSYVCLNIGETYFFNANDSYGDGWNSDGVYELSICDQGVIIANNSGNSPNDFGLTEEFIVISSECNLYGCLDFEACNFDSGAIYDSNCIYPENYYDCDGNCINDLNSNNICDEIEIYGCTDQIASNYFNEATFDDGSCLYSNICNENEIQIDVLIQTDYYPNETSFVLNNNQGVIFASENSVFNEGNFAYPFQYCLPDIDCYIFTIYDSYGDGLFSEGGVEIYYEGDLVLEDPSFQYNTSITMNCPPGYDCNTSVEVELGEHLSETNDFWYLFTPDSNGQYNINTCLSNCNTVIYVYDYCTGLIVDETNEGTIYYNDDLCGLQSEISPLFVEGESYYIRIKGDCDNIEWELNYEGPVSGCIDELACNFNPIAEIDDNTCIYPGDPDCSNGPDLMVMPFESSMYLQIYNNEDGCAIEEGCLTGYGTRSIIRFDTWIKNVGNLDYFIGSVDDNENTNQFEWDMCHNHWHYKGYAEYVLFDSDGQILPVGFKNGFCVMDLECSGDTELGVPAGNFTYGCSIMGISAGCGDIYSSGLSCQWIDITDVPDGSYTFVVRTNWDQDPDAAGNVELSFDNNWEQTCIVIYTNEDGNKDYYMAVDIDGDGINNNDDNDVDGDGIDNVFDLDSDNDGIYDADDNSPLGLFDCPTYSDCNGIEFGSTQFDCNGICGGNAVNGDLNMDSFLDLFDLQQYSLEIIANDWSANQCNDLDMDGEITVSDIALAVNCVENSQQQLTRDNQTTPCDFGMEINNPNDTVTLSIGQINIEESYVDVYILNPNNEVLGYQFTMGNIIINSIENLVPDYQVQPQFSALDGMILGVSYDNSLIIKNYEPAPLCRVYFSSIDENTCIDNIIDIVNQNYENVYTINNTDPCISNININQYDDLSFFIYPNPAKKHINVKINIEKRSDVVVSLKTVLGKSISTKYVNRNNEILTFDVENLSSGVYLVNIDYRNTKFVRQVIVE